MTEVHFYKPEIPESIWIDRGPNGGWMFRTEKLLNSVRQYVPADTIEAQAAEIKRLRGIVVNYVGPFDVTPDDEVFVEAVQRAALGETE